MSWQKNLLAEAYIAEMREIAMESIARHVREMQRVGNTMMNPEWVKACEIFSGEKAKLTLDQLRTIAQVNFTDQERDEAGLLAVKMFTDEMNNIAENHDLTANITSAFRYRKNRFPKSLQDALGLNEELPLYEELGTTMLEKVCHTALERLALSQEITALYFFAIDGHRGVQSTGKAAISQIGDAVYSFRQRAIAQLAQLALFAPESMRETMTREVGLYMFPKALGASETNYQIMHLTDIYGKDAFRSGSYSSSDEDQLLAQLVDAFHATGQPKGQ